MIYLLLLWLPAAVVVGVVLCKSIRIADGIEQPERPSWLD